jgi:molecular chaperone DnaK
MISAMKIFHAILDRLLTAPGETPNGALARRSNSTAAVRPSVSSAGKPELTGPGGNPKTAEPSPTVYLLLDVSQSMDEAKLRQATDGSISFAEDAVRKGYLVGVIQFSTLARLKVEPTTSRRAIEKGLSQVGFQMTTNMAAAIELATNLFGRSKGQRAVVLVTDGYPDSAAAALAAADQAKGRGITIIAIGTDDADRNFLKKLASASKLATTVPNSELKVTIAKAAGLLPAKSSNSR